MNRGNLGGTKIIWSDRWSHDEMDRFNSGEFGKIQEAREQLFFIARSTQSANFATHKISVASFFSPCHMLAINFVFACRATNANISPDEE